MVPSKKVAELVFTSNHATFGSIPDFFGGLTNLTALALSDNPFIGNIPGKALVSLWLSFQHLATTFTCCADIVEKRRICLWSNALFVLIWQIIHSLATFLIWIDPYR